MPSEPSVRISFHGIRYPWAYEARVDANPALVLGRIKQVRKGWEIANGTRFDTLAAAGRYLYDQEARRVGS